MQRDSSTSLPTPPDLPTQFAEELKENGPSSTSNGKCRCPSQEQAGQEQAAAVKATATTGALVELEQHHPRVPTGNEEPVLGMNQDAPYTGQR